MVVRLTIDGGRLLATVTTARDILVRTSDRTFSTTDLVDVTREIQSVAAGLLRNQP